MIQPAVALRVERPDELGDERAQRDRHAGLAGGRRDDAHVLVVQRDAETGREVAGQHAGRLAVEDRVAGPAATSGRMEEKSITRVPGLAFANTPSSPPSTAATSGESGSIVATTSAPVTASATLDAPRPPAATRASTLGRLRL